MNSHQRRKSTRAFIKRALRGYDQDIPAHVYVEVKCWPGSRKRKLVMDLLRAAERRGCMNLYDQVNHQTTAARHIMFAAIEVAEHSLPARISPEKVLGFLLSTPA